MTTKSQATQYGRLREAAVAAQLLESRFGNLRTGSADVTAAADAQALITVLKAATTAYNAGSWSGSSAPYVLTWSTSGANDATTKAQLLEWLQGGRRAPVYGACHGLNNSLVPTLGADLLALFNQL